MTKAIKLQKKRSQALAREKHKQQLLMARARQFELSGNENLPFEPLGVALGNKIINKTQYDIGRKYEEYYTKVFGKPHAKTLNLINHGEVIFNEEKEIAEKTMLNNMDKLLANYRKDVIDVCVYHQFPKKFKNLKIGLNKLLGVDIYGKKR